MTPEIRRRIHAFRNALVPAADTPAQMNASGWTADWR